MLDNSLQRDMEDSTATRSLKRLEKPLSTRFRTIYEQSQDSHGVVERVSQTARLASDRFVIHPFVLHLSAIHRIVLRRTLFKPSCL